MLCGKGSWCTWVVAGVKTVGWCKVGKDTSPPKSPGTSWELALFEGALVNAQFCGETRASDASNERRNSSRSTRLGGMWFQPGGRFWMKDVSSKSELSTSGKFEGPETDLLQSSSASPTTAFIRITSTLGISEPMEIALEAETSEVQLAST